MELQYFNCTHHGHNQVMSVPKFGLLMDKVASQSQ
jgi:hypothetical protein